MPGEARARSAELSVSSSDPAGSPVARNSYTGRSRLRQARKGWCSDDGVVTFTDINFIPHVNEWFLCT